MAERAERVAPVEACLDLCRYSLSPLVEEIDSKAKDSEGTPSTMCAYAFGGGATRGMMRFNPLRFAQDGSGSPICLIAARDTERMDSLSLLM